MRCEALNRVEIGNVESADGKPLDIHPRQCDRIAQWNDLAGDPIDRRVLVTPTPTRSNSETMSNIHDAQHMELRPIELT